jgi:hypothetical protein
MDRLEALGTLGLSHDATWSDVRDRYIDRVRTAHPDIARGDPSATERTMRLTEAYAVLREQRDALPLLPVAEPPGPRPSVDGVLDLDTGGASDTFATLLAAAGRAGVVSYADPDDGVLQVVLRPPRGPACQLLVTVDRSAAPEQVAFTLDSLTTEPAPPIDQVLVELLGVRLEEQPGARVTGPYR